MNETLESLTAHRDQLKAENDKLNPQVDALTAEGARLQESLRVANETIETERQAAAAARADAAKHQEAKAHVVSLASEMLQKVAKFAE